MTERFPSRAGCRAGTGSPRRAAQLLRLAAVVVEAGGKVSRAVEEGPVEDAAAIGRRAAARLPAFARA